MYLFGVGGVEPPSEKVSPPASTSIVVGIVLGPCPASVDTRNTASSPYLTRGSGSPRASPKSLRYVDASGPGGDFTGCWVKQQPVQSWCCQLGVWPVVNAVSSAARCNKRFDHTVETGSPPLSMYLAGRAGPAHSLYRMHADCCLSLDQVRSLELGVRRQNVMLRKT